MMIGLIASLVLYSVFGGKDKADGSPNSRGLLQTWQATPLHDQTRIDPALRTAMMEAPVMQVVVMQA